MELSVRGHPKRVSKSIIRKATAFFADKLMQERLHENCLTEILFVDHTSPDLGKDDCGSTIAVYDDYYRHRAFEIFIFNNLTRKETLYTLAHEMVHVKQYAKGERYDFLKKYKHAYRWRGELFSMTTDEDYWYAPWEIEARGYEDALVRSFVKEMRDQGVDISGRTQQ